MGTDTRDHAERERRVTQEQDVTSTAAVVSGHIDYSNNEKTRVIKRSENERGEKVENTNTNVYVTDNETKLFQ